MKGTRGKTNDRTEDMNTQSIQIGKKANPSFLPGYVLCVPCYGTISFGFLPAKSHALQFAPP